MADPPTPHDALFRAAFLRDHLPNEIAALLDVTTPEKVDATFVDEALAGSQSDALFRVRTLSGDEALCYLLVEHKSTPDIDLPLQLGHYMIRIWRGHVKEHGAASRRRLPPIIVPLVLYAGTRDWTVPEGIGDMIAGDPELAFLPGASYILRNLCGASGQDHGTALMGQQPALEMLKLCLRRALRGGWAVQDRAGLCPIGTPGMS